MSDLTNNTTFLGEFYWANAPEFDQNGQEFKLVSSCECGSAELWTTSTEEYTLLSGYKCTCGDGRRSPINR